MICDSHCHLKHGDAEGTEYSPKAIVEMMDAAGIEKAVVFAMSTTTKRSVEMAEDAVREFPDRLIAMSTRCQATNARSVLNSKMPSPRGDSAASRSTSASARWRIT